MGEKLGASPPPSLSVLRPRPRYSSPSPLACHGRSTGGETFGSLRKEDDRQTFGGACTVWIGAVYHQVSLSMNRLYLGACRSMEEAAANLKWGRRRQRGGEKKKTLW